MLKHKVVALFVGLIISSSTFAGSIDYDAKSKAAAEKIDYKEPCGQEKINCIGRGSLNGKILHDPSEFGVGLRADPLIFEASGRATSARSSMDKAFKEFEEKKAREISTQLRQACPNGSSCQIDALIIYNRFGGGEIREVYSAKVASAEKPKAIVVTTGSPEEVFLKFWKSTDCKEMKSLAGNMWAKFISEHRTDDTTLCNTFTQMHKNVFDVNITNSKVNSDGTVSISSVLLLKNNAGDMVQTGFVGKLDGKWQLLK